MTPSTPDEVAAALRRAADARQTIAIRGAGTKSDWGRDGARADAILDMRGLNRVLAHEWRRDGPRARADRVRDRLARARGRFAVRAADPLRVGRGCGRRAGR